ncbi:MAG: Sua5/YciO/YrdC/YwlC family protein, partial [Actinomycetota bacterium]|nr:Sua5/YciO/YrdC/YwlC family protein [Actinomycetota bacterium]
APSLVADVLATCGVLAATSANTHGEPTLVTPSQILDQLGVRAAAIAAYVEGGRLESTPSSVVNIGSDGWTMLRDGPLTRFELDQLLGVGATGS